MALGNGSNPFRDPLLVEDYEAWYEGPGRRADWLEKALLSHLMDWLGGGGTLLDVGSGTGHFGRYFSRLGLRVAGVDISVPMLQDATRLGNPSCILGDALRLPFDDRSFDLVATVTTLAFVTAYLLRTSGTSSRSPHARWGLPLTTPTPRRESSSA